MMMSILALLCLMGSAVCLWLVFHFIRRDNSFWKGLVPLLVSWGLISLAFPACMDAAGSDPIASSLQFVKNTLEYVADPIFCAFLAFLAFAGAWEAWGTKKEVTLKGLQQQAGPDVQHPRQWDWFALCLFLGFVFAFATLWHIQDSGGKLFAGVKLPDYERPALATAEDLAKEIDSYRIANQLEFTRRPYFSLNLYEQDYTIQGQDQWKKELKKQFNRNALTKTWTVEKVVRIHFEQRVSGRIEAIVTYEAINGAGKKFRGLRRMADTLGPGGIDEWAKINLIPKLLALKELEKSYRIASSLATHATAVPEVPRFTIYDNGDGDYVTTQ